MRCGCLLEEEQVITFEAVRNGSEHRETVRPVTEVEVEAAELSSFDVVVRAQGGVGWIRRRS